MTNENQTKETSTKPVSTANIGLVRSAIFARDTEFGTRYRTKLECSYKDADGKWQTKLSYDLDDLLAVRELASRAIDEILNLQNSAV